MNYKMSILIMLKQLAFPIANDQLLMIYLGKPMLPIYERNLEYTINNF